MGTVKGQSKTGLMLRQDQPPTIYRSYGASRIDWINTRPLSACPPEAGKGLDRPSKGLYFQQKYHFHTRTELNLIFCDLKNFSAGFFLEKGIITQPLASFFPPKSASNPG